jgi:hypothetical protein
LISLGLGASLWSGERAMQTFPNPTNRSKARIYDLRM